MQRLVGTQNCRDIPIQFSWKKQKKETRGRPRNTTKKEDQELIRVVKKLHEENVNNDVTARQINGEWNTETKVSDATVSRRFREKSRGWKKCKDQMVHTPQDKTLRVARCTLHIARCTLHVARCTLHVARCTLHAARCTLHVARCTLHVARCIVHVARCTLHVARCIVHSA